MSTTARSVCPLDCPDTCSMVVTVEGAAQVDLVLDVIRAAKARLVSLTPHQQSLEELLVSRTQDSAEVGS